MAKTKITEELSESAIGSYLLNKLRKKKISDDEAAALLSIAPSTLRKVFNSQDLYISRLEKFSILLNEDVIGEYYYSKEPLKRFKDAEIKLWQQKIDDLQQKIDSLSEIKEKMQETIDTQKTLIDVLRNKAKK